MADFQLKPATIPKLKHRGIYDKIIKEFLKGKAIECEISVKGVKPQHVYAALERARRREGYPIKAYFSKRLQKAYIEKISD